MSESILTGSALSSTNLSWEYIGTISSFTQNSYGSGGATLKSLMPKIKQYFIFQAAATLTSQITTQRSGYAVMLSFVGSSYAANGNNTSSSTNYIAPGTMISPLYFVICPSVNTSASIANTLNGSQNYGYCALGIYSFLDYTKTIFLNIGYATNVSGILSVDVYGILGSTILAL